MELSNIFLQLHFKKVKRQYHLQEEDVEEEDLEEEDLEEDGSYFATRYKAPLNCSDLLVIFYKSVRVCVRAFFTP